MTRTGILALAATVGLMLVGLVGCYRWLHGTPSRQERVITIEISPDRKWQASITEILADPGGLSLELWDTVDVASISEPTIRQTMLWMDAAGMGGAVPVIRWASPDTLQVTLPNISYARGEHQEFQGVHLDIRFDPPDSDARSAWLSEYYPEDREVLR